MTDIKTKSDNKPLRTIDVMQKMAISRSTLTRRVSDGMIHRPIKVGPRSYWLSDEIDALIDSLAATRNSRKMIGKGGGLTM